MTNYNLKKFILAIFVISLITIPFTACGKQPKKINTKIDCTAEFGYNGKLAIKGGSPLKFEVVNQGEEFKGFIEYMINPTQRGDETLYRIPITVPANSTKIFKSYKKINRIPKNTLYRITDNNYVYAVGSIAKPRLYNPNTTTIAIISDKKDNYNHFNALDSEKSFLPEVDYNRYNWHDIRRNGRVKLQATQSTFLNTDEILKDKNALNYFDIILLGDITNLKLNEENTKNIIDWINEGGIFIIESGENYSKVVKNLPSALQQINFNKVEQVTNTPDNLFAGTLAIATGENTRKTVKNLKISGFDILKYENLGKGKLVTLSTLLNSGDAKIWNIKGKLTLEIIMTLFNISDKNRFDEYESNFLNRHSFELRYLPKDKIINPHTLLILLIYILLIAPISYFILKKVKKRKLIWITIPTAAILLTLVFPFFINSELKNKPIINKATIIDYNSDNKTANLKTRLCVFNNNKNRLITEYDKNDKFTKKNDRYPFDRGRSSSDVNLTTKDFENINLTTNDTVEYGEKTKLTDFHVNLWHTSEMQTSKILDFSANNPTAELIMKDGIKTLRFKNDTIFDMSTPILYYRGSYFKLDDIESGQTVDIDITNSEKIDTKKTFKRKEYDKYGRIRDSFEKKVIRKIRNSMSYKPIDEVNIVSKTKIQDDNSLVINGKKPYIFSETYLDIKLTLEDKTTNKVTLNKHNIRTNYILSEDPYEKCDGKVSSYIQISWDKNRNNEETTIWEKEEDPTLFAEFYIPKNIIAKQVTLDLNMTLEKALDRLKRQNPRRENSIIKDLENMQTDLDYYILNPQTKLFEKIKLKNTKLFGKKPYNVDIEKYIKDEKFVIKATLIKGKNNNINFFVKELNEIKPMDIEIKGERK